MKVTGIAELDGQFKDYDTPESRSSTSRWRRWKIERERGTDTRRYTRRVFSCMVEAMNKPCKICGKPATKVIAIATNVVIRLCHDCWLITPQLAFEDDVIEEANGQLFAVVAIIRHVKGQRRAYHSR
jgi:hypothetical protein